jgi:hypothetical protein
MTHVNATLDKFGVPGPERSETITFIGSTKADFVEV